jgi:hypothetical protein
MVPGLIGVVIAVLVVSLVAPGGHPSAGQSPLAGAHSALSPLVAAPNPFFTGMAASVALGAPNLTSHWTGTPRNNSSFGPDPELACVDGQGDIWVPNFSGARVTEFTPPFVSGEAASVVLGQPNFTATLHNTTSTTMETAAACTTDAHGDLWVSDYVNERVLEFVPPFHTGQAASLVLGQSSFAGNAPGTTAENLSGPVGLAFDSNGDLWVADSGNNRVLEFTPPFSTGMSASIVLGQPNLTTGYEGRSASNLSEPQGIAFAYGVLWVADFGNDRVVGFAAPFSTAEGATYLFGQSSFASSGATGPGAFAEAASVAGDSRGDLWVSDFSGNRVVEFEPPFTTFENASVVIGQTTLTAELPGDNATTLDEPFGAFVAPNGALWVDDATNNRMLEFVPSSYHISFTATGLPSTTTWSVLVGGTSEAATGPSVLVPEENGSYAWAVPAIPGYSVSPASGTAVVNGANALVNLTVTQVTYSVTFESIGLPAASAWSVTLGGVLHTSPNNGTISFTEPNGTFTYTVTAISGYNDTPKGGSVLVRGGSQEVAIGFFVIPTTGSSTSSSPFSTTETVLFIVIAAVLGAIVGALLARRGKGGAAAHAPPTAPPAMWSEGPPSAGSTPAPPPPGAGGPPPGAMG